VNIVVGGGGVVNVALFYWCQCCYLRV
jgi:hypothetical protein